jgi:hypothetical protein
LGDGNSFWPSFFTETSRVDTSSVSALACGQRVVSVANLEEPKRRAHITSSQARPATAGRSPTSLLPAPASSPPTASVIRTICGSK